MTNVLRSTTIRQCLPQQHRPSRRPRRQGQRTSVGLRALAQVGQTAVHRGRRHPDSIVGDLDLDRVAARDPDTGAGGLSMSGDVRQPFSNDRDQIGLKVNREPLEGSFDREIRRKAKGLRACLLYTSDAADE